MSKFILLGLFLGLLTTMFYLPVPMDKIESTLDQNQIPFLEGLPPKHLESVPTQKGFRALLDHSPVEESTLTRIPVEKNKISYQHKLAISTQSLNY